MSENYALDYSLHRLNPTLEGAQEHANRSGGNIQPPQQPDIYLKTNIRALVKFIL